MAGAKVILVLPLLFVGCGGSVSTQVVNPPPPPPPSAEFLYQVPFANGLQASALNPTSGALGLPIDAASTSLIENTGLHPIVTPSGKFLYVQGFDQDPLTSPPVPPVNAIYCFAINGSNGELTNLPGSPFIASNLLDTSLFIGPEPNGIAMDGKGRFFYLSGFGDSFSVSGQPTNSIRAYSIDTTTGALQNGPVLTSTSTYSLSAQAIDPTNSYLYAATVLSGSIDVSVYSINSSTLALTEISGSPFLVANTDPGQEYNLSLFTTPSGNFLYAVVINNFGNSEVTVFSSDSVTGSLAPIAGSPFPIGDVSTAMLHPSGRFLITVARGSAISVFAVDPMNGTVSVSPASSTTISSYAGQTLVDPSGQFLLFNDSYSTASSFSIDSSTGSLTLITGSPFSVEPGWETAIIVKTQ